MAKKLYTHQELMIEKIRDCFRNGKDKVVLCAPTGSGKSVVMSHMIKSAIEKNKHVLVLLDRRILTEQMSEHLDAMGIDHGVMMAGHWRYRPDKLVQVASIQTIERMETFPRVDICFIDEVHAMMRQSVLKMLHARKTLRVVGVTATPFNAKLGDVFQGVVSTITMRELTNNGYLAPLKFFSAQEIDTTGVKVVGGEWDEKEMSQRGTAIVGDIVADYLTLAHQNFGKKTKAICFSSGIAHGAMLAEKFNEAGVVAIQLTCDSTDEYKKQAIEEFSKPDTFIDILISADLLTRGFDVPDIVHVILATAVRKSFSKYVQMVGRGARIHHSKDTCIVQDHGGNYLRFLEPWNELYGMGVDTLNSGADDVVRKEKTDKEKKDSVCPQCKIIKDAPVPICLNCGYTYPLKNEVVAVAGKMVEMDGGVEKKEKFSSEYKEDFYQQLLGYCDAKGFKDGFAWHAYKQKFNVYPSWKKVKKTHTEEVTNFIKHLAIKKAKGKK